MYGVVLICTHTVVSGFLILFIIHFILFTSMNYCTDFQQDEPVERDTEAIKEEAEKWVSRCKTGASVVMSCWIGWIITAQLLRDQLPSSLFMLTSDDSAATGW